MAPPQMTSVLGQIGVTVQPLADLDSKQGKRLFWMMMMIRLTLEVLKTLNAKEWERLTNKTVYFSPVKVLLKRV
jgi:hypothetical protein